MADNKKGLENEDLEKVSGGIITTAERNLGNTFWKYPNKKDYGTLYFYAAAAIQQDNGSFILCGYDITYYPTTLNYQESEYKTLNMEDMTRVEEAPWWYKG